MAIASTDIAPAKPVRRLRRHWRRWLLLGASALVVLGAGGLGIGFAVYAHSYQPLGVGLGSRPGSASIERIWDGVNDTAYILRSRLGSTGRVEYMLANSGSHSVRILGIPADDALPGVTASWAPFSPARQGQVGGLQQTDRRPFPAEMWPGDTIALWVTVTKPACQLGTTETLGSILLDWSALGVHHAFTFPLVAANGFPADPPSLPIDLCYPASALSHIDPD